MTKRTSPSNFRHWEEAIDLRRLEVRRRAATPVMLERGQRRILVKAAGHAPVILQRIHYYEDAPFKGLWDA